MIIVNLLGGPSTGKSTTLYELAAKLKKDKINIKTNLEYVKDWALIGKNINKYDQMYIMAKEMKAISDYINKVDVLICDSPVYLAAYYNEKYNNNKILRPVMQEFYKYLKEDNVTVFNFLLKRNKPYCEKGRYQSEEESKQIDYELQVWLDANDVDYVYLDCEDNDRLSVILDILNIAKGI